IIQFLLKNDPSALRFKREVASAPEPPREVASYTYSYEIKNISIPLATRDASRIAYAQFSLKLDLPSDEAKRSFAAHRARVLNTVYQVASAFYVEDFSPEKGGNYERFKEELRKSLSGEFRAYSPRELAIENWILN
ncbi:MAG: flagellar basal body-associated FliL family protein, partial [Bdellovibrionales bacterium]|nr:flagellar basal body-associated FliL family protein [Bdellovibrionales bacterium]